jgi:hypothetical protein
MSDENAEVSAVASSEGQVEAGQALAGQEVVVIEPAGLERPETVPEKFWDTEKGEVRVDDALKSYSELEKRFGSFTGAPEEYAVGLSEELTEQGVSINKDDPMMESALEFAKNSNMSQEGFNNMIELYAVNQLAMAKAEQEAMQADIASLGDNADRRINSLDQWANKNMPADLAEGFKDMAVSSQAIKAMEQMVSMTRAAPVQANDASASPSITREEVSQMQFAKDEHGNRKISVDPAFRKEYERKLNLVYGQEEHREVIG